MSDDYFTYPDARSRRERLPSTIGNLVWLAVCVVLAAAVLPLTTATGVWILGYVLFAAVIAPVDAIREERRRRHGR
jgi:hypothetical protein